MTTLVCIYHDGKEYIYSRYVGKTLTDKLAFLLPLAHYWIEELRNAPQNFSRPPEPEAA